jgi:hypothetical protein
MLVQFPGHNPGYLPSYLRIERANSLLTSCKCVASKADTCGHKATCRVWVMYGGSVNNFNAAAYPPTAEGLASAGTRLTPKASRGYQWRENKSRNLRSAAVTPKRL